MYGFLTKLLISGKLKFTEGEVDFCGKPMTFLPLQSMKYMTDDAIKNGKQAINQLYLYGWHFGFLFTDVYMRTFKLKPFEETFKLIMDVASLIGYGDYQTLEFKQKKYSKFKNISNPFGMLYYPSKDRVCHFIRGVNAGGGAALHGVLMDGIELECTSGNKKFCLFMNISTKMLREDSQFKAAVEEQLDMDWLQPKELEIIKSLKGNPDDYLKFPD